MIYLFKIKVHHTPQEEKKTKKTELRVFPLIPKKNYGDTKRYLRWGRNKTSNLRGF